MRRPSNATQRYRAGFIQRDLVAELEGLGARALPALETLEVDGWRLRSARGFSKRANSVWPRAGAGRVPLDRKLAHAERFYDVRGLPACFQLSPSSDPLELDRLLGERGYEVVAPTAVRSGKLAGPLAGIDPDAGAFTIHRTTQPDPRWLATWSSLRSPTKTEAAAAAEVFRRVPATSAYLVATVDDVDVATVRGVADAGWLGICDLAVDRAAHRQGAASALLHALTRWARDQGVERIWAQVEVANDPAVALFKRLGLRVAYEYRYRLRQG